MADNQVEEIKQNIDIVTLIGERVNLKKAGRNFKGLCPFHGEKTPSFFVTPDMQMYKCFGCAKSGDIFSFVMEFEGLTFPEALEQLATRAGVVLEKRERTTGEQKRERVLELLHLASEYYHYLLTEHEIGRKAINYLKKRGITNQAIKDFKLGYSIDSWDALQKYLIHKKKYTTEELEAAGLVIRSDRGGYYDRFRGRIMFPLVTYSGKIVGFSGRTLDPDAKEAKYINSPETDYYHKSELLYGITQAKRSIKEKDRIIIVEGELDVISSHQIGLKEVVAIKGSALTQEQASLIRRLTHNVILALDADAAGQEAIHRGIGVCETQALNLRVARLSGGKDPDELSKNDPKALKALMLEAQSVYSYLIESACEQFDPTSGEGKKKIVQTVMPQLSKIEHAVEREFYVKKLAQSLKVSESAIVEEVIKAKRFQPSGYESNQTTKSPKFNRREVLERQVVGLALHLNRPVEALQTVNTDWFEEPHLRRLLEALRQVSVTSKGMDCIAHLPSEIHPLAQDVYTMQVSWLEESQETLKNLFKDTIFTLELTWAKQYLVTLTKQMTQSSLDPATQSELQSLYRQTAARINQLEIEGGRSV